MNSNLEGITFAPKPPADFRRDTNLDLKRARAKTNLTRELNNAVNFKR